MAPAPTPKLDLTGVPECTRCGTCCFSETEDYLQVLGVDYERLADDAERWVHFIGNRAYMKMSDGHCSALVFDQDRSLFLCSIYERRPDVCRWLERGSGQCAAERHEKAERPIQLSRKATPSPD
jgi:Fe-S-cluster containining protein